MKGWLGKGSKATDPKGNKGKISGKEESSETVEDDSVEDEFLQGMQVSLMDGFVL